MTTKAFELLSEPIQHCLYRMGWSELRPIQSDAIRAVLHTEKDLIISASTASGKTEAAFLPIISRLSEFRGKSVKALYVSPLKALINDQFRRLEELCEYAEISVHRWHGDVGQSPKAKLVENPSGILLTTPESLESIFINRSNALARLFCSLDFVVIDELHAFVGRERGTQLRSLLSRLEQKIDKPFRIFALSATLGEWSSQYAEWLRPGKTENVEIISSPVEAKTIRLKIYGYPSEVADTVEVANDGEEETIDNSAVVDDLMACFGGRKGLVFANRKNDVEYFADALNERCSLNGTPQSFLVHHGSVSKEVREYTEEMMRGPIPFTTLCSSTLELGIDIGDVQAVGQLGAPWSVSSLIQRLGRSGRRGDDASEIRIFIDELPTKKKDASLLDRLHIELLQAVALTELMLEKWLEPPEHECFDPSTFVQQILSVLKETGGVNANELFTRLIGRGAFRSFNKTQFVSILWSLGQKQLVEQMTEGDLILGIEGERIVKSYEFYSAFQSGKELNVVHSGKTIGSISALNPPAVSDHLLLAGRRWQIVDVRLRTSVVNVVIARGRKPASFVPSGGAIHDKVRQKMREVLFETRSFAYLNKGALGWLEEARNSAASAQLGANHWHELSHNSSLLFSWAGSRTQRTIELIARSVGIAAIDRNVAIEFQGPSIEIRRKLLLAIENNLSSNDLADQEPNQQLRKYDGFLPEDVLRDSFVRNALNLESGKSLLLSLCR